MIKIVLKKQNVATQAWEITIYYKFELGLKFFEFKIII
jgi:hypothetical protein